MSVNIRIPTPLRGFVGGAADMEVEAATVEEALEALVDAHPALRPHLYGEDGRLRNFVNTYLNDEDVRHLDGPSTPVGEGDRVMIVPSIAGGAPGSEGSGAATTETGGRGGDRGAEGGGPVDRTAAETSASGGVAPGTEPSRGAGGGLDLTPEEALRYSRHLIMPEVGPVGQMRLKESKVLLVGAGGLGSPLGLYLAAAGVGTLGLVDFDVVDATNLQRQLLHGTKDVGRPKLESARERLRDVNPNVEVVAHEIRLTSENALDVLEPYDVVVDGTDNFPTRYLVNDACVLLGKPNVYGSIFRFEGQVAVFDASRGPCYRCLFREPPPPGLVPSCAEGGVLGVLPGIIGSLQAVETVKLLLGIGSPLVGRLVVFDALEPSWRELRLRKDPACPVCGEAPSITELIDYEEFCGVPALEDPEPVARDDVPEVTASELDTRLSRGDALTLVDVREPFEWTIGNLGDRGARLVPLGELTTRLDELDPSEEIVLYCRSGARSATALKRLREEGFERLWNLRGGILAWSRAVDPTIPRY